MAHDSKPCRLFVYGSLAPGCPNEHMLKPLGGTWEIAWVKGMLHQEGWGAAMGFPGLILDPGGERIPGQLLHSEGLEAVWPELDAFEGEGYERILTWVERAGKPALEAFVYALAQVD